MGKAPNIGRIGNEGAKFMTYYVEQSCTAGRTTFLTGMQPVRVGMVLPETARPTFGKEHIHWLASCMISATTLGNSARTILATTPRLCLPRIVFRTSEAISITSMQCRV